jgi:hypothetical protein
VSLRTSLAMLAASSSRESLRFDIRNVPARGQGADGSSGTCLSAHSVENAHELARYCQSLERGAKGAGGTSTSHARGKR